jgi:Family of unknown function (DUF5946)
MQAPTKTLPTCNCCGAVVPDGYESCASMFQTVLGREYRDPAFGESHLFTVDAHALQHSEEHAPRSNAFHLMRLCWLLEHAGNPSIRQVQRAGGAFYRVQSMVRPARHRSGSAAREQAFRQLPFLEPPASRGKLTVVSVLTAKTPEEHAQLARAWGQSVWEAWSIHHAWAREQVQQWFHRE